MGTPLQMDVSSIRGLMTLVVQLHTIIIFAQALSEEGARPGRLKPTAPSGGAESSSPVPCCRNGGLCVLGSFCHCPKNFYGRYCEYELKRTPCGHIPHGSWVKAGCNLCRCFDGHMTCLPRAFDGCDDKPHTEEPDPWDYKDEMVILSTGDASSSSSSASSSSSSQPEDSADYYDYYDSGGGGGGGSKHSASSGSSAVRSPLTCYCRFFFSVFVAVFSSVSWTWLCGASWNHWTLGS